MGDFPVVKIQDFKMKLFAFFAFAFAQENQCPVNTEPGYCDDMLNLPSHLPYQRSCDKFIQCDEYGMQYLCDCPDGLYYNHRDGVCEWPDARECCMKNDGLAHRPCSSGSPDLCEVDTRPGYCDGVTNIPAYLNDDQTCTGYLKCDEFGGQFQCDCPAGLMWNKGACSWPSENVGACCDNDGAAERPCTTN